MESVSGIRHESNGKSGESPEKSVVDMLDFGLDNIMQNFAKMGSVKS